MAFEFTERVEQDYFDDLMALYREAWWTGRRTREEVRRMLAGSGVVFGVVDAEHNRLVGITRVLTDFVFRAHIYDVIVLEEYRGRGVGRLLMDAVVRHPRLKDVEKFELTCKEELIPLYSKWDFEVGGDGLNFMSRQAPGG